MSLMEKLEIYAKNNLNVMLIGSHGIGKSTIVKSIMDKINLRFKYYSSSTLDPFADLVGIPAPDKDAGILKFYRPEDLLSAEVIFFDELNRAHPRVLNSVLEIVQFKTVNGFPLPNLKMVWAAINPPGEDYQVEDLDPALIDRFHQYIKMNSEINLDYLSTKMRPDIASMLKDWWEMSLNDEMKRIITPRRIEYLGMMITKEIPWHDAIPQGHIAIPVDELERQIRILNGKEEDFIINRESIVAKRDALLERVKQNPKHAIPIAKHMEKFTEEELFQCRELMESMPKELVIKVGQCKFNQRKRLFKDLFIKNNIDINQYPKVSQAFEPIVDDKPQG